jgi:HEAT repeat protein
MPFEGRSQAHSRHFSLLAGRFVPERSKQGGATTNKKVGIRARLDGQKAHTRVGSNATGGQAQAHGEEASPMSASHFFRGLAVTALTLVPTLAVPGQVLHSRGLSEEEKQQIKRDLRLRLERFAQPPGPADEQCVRDAGIGQTDAELVAFLRRQWGEKDVKQVPRLIKQLDSDVFAEREQATEELVLMGPAALAQLQRATREGGPEVAGRAKRCIEAIEKNEFTALSAVRVLAGHKAVAPLQALLSSKSPAGQMLVARALGFLGTAAKPSVPALIETLADMDREGHKEVCEALQKILDESCLELVLRATRDNRPAVREGMYKQLYRYHKHADVVVPIILEGMRDEVPEVRRAATAATTCYSHPDIVSRLIEALKDKDRPANKFETRVASHAVSSLGLKVSWADKSLPSLTEVARNSPDMELRYGAVWSLGHIGHNARRFAPNIVPTLVEGSRSHPGVAVGSKLAFAPKAKLATS